MSADDLAAQLAADDVDGASRGQRLASTVAVFRRWLYLPNPAPLYVVLAAVVVNRLDGDPLWLMVVAPPSAGKTEMLNALGGLADVHHAATLTETSLLSGTPAKERENGSTGGLLRQIGERGLLVCKDFTSVLSMHHEKRAETLAALREIHDGRWDRPVGTAGGRVLHWSGKLGLIAGCTPVIDRHALAIASLGERFLSFRIETADAEAQAEQALRNAGRESQMRRELEGAVSGFLGDLDDPNPAALADGERRRLVALAHLVTRCRSVVDRDRQSRDIELVMDPEMPARLAGQLGRLRVGLAAIGVEYAETWSIVDHAAWGSIPQLRRLVLARLLGRDEPLPLREIAPAIGYPDGTTRRALEDLVAHGVIVRQRQEKANVWTLTAWARARAQLIFPATAPPLYAHAERGGDFAGKEAAAGVDRLPRGPYDQGAPS